MPAKRVGNKQFRPSPSSRRAERRCGKKLGEYGGDHLQLQSGEMWNKKQETRPPRIHQLTASSARRPQTWKRLVLMHCRPIKPTQDR